VNVQPFSDAVELVLDAFASRRLIGLLSDRDGSLDEDAAYAIASQVHARRVQRGENPVGRKIRVHQPHDLDAVRRMGPDLGPRLRLHRHLLARGEAEVAVGHLIQPRIEPEI
jgi:2-keto-4-pentenoate hydratase